MSGDRDGFVFIETGGSDRFNLSQLDKIRCPDCGKADLVKAMERDIWFCSVCGLRLPESQLGEAVTVIPDTSQGISAQEKPYYQYLERDKKPRASDGRPQLFAVSLQEEDNTKILAKYSLGGLAQAEKDKAGGVTITQQGNRVTYPSAEVKGSIKSIMRKLFPINATDIKIDLK